MIAALKKKLTVLVAVSLAIMFLAPSAALAAADINNSLCAGTKVQITVNPSEQACQKVTDGATSDANNTIKTIINILTAVVGVLAVIMIIIAGFRYVTSGGSDEAVKGAKNTILYAIIGLVVVALAQIIVHFVIHTAATPTQTCSGHKVQNGPNKGDKC